MRRETGAQRTRAPRPASRPICWPRGISVQPKLIPALQASVPWDSDGRRGRTVPSSSKRILLLSGRRSVCPADSLSRRPHDGFGSGERRTDWEARHHYPLVSKCSPVCRRKCFVCPQTQPGTFFPVSHQPELGKEVVPQGLGPEEAESPLQGRVGKGSKGAGKESCPVVCPMSGPLNPPGLLRSPNNPNRGFW